MDTQYESADWHPHDRPWGEALERGWSLREIEREYILAVLEYTGGHRSRAARILGIDRRTLYRKLRELESLAEMP
jgi:DNA-binding NtrC family response regulator